MKDIVGVVLALGFGLGMAGLGFAIRGRRRRGARADEIDAAIGSGASLERSSSEGVTWTWRLVVSLAAAALVAVTTRWVVPAVFAGMGAFLLAKRLARAPTPRVTDKVEAIAVWTELLRDTLAASAGLAQSVIATASAAPTPIKEHVERLGARLASGVGVESALRSFALEVDDPSADMVVCALVLAARSRAQRLVELLTALADATRDDVGMRLRVEASRASARSSVRTVVVFSLAFSAALLLLAHAYLSPFGSVAGQLVLAAVGLLYLAGLALMVRMVRPRPGVRLIGSGSTS